MNIFNPTSKLDYYQNTAYSASYDPTSANTWEDWDISAIVSGAHAVVVCSANTGSGHDKGCRSNGDTSNVVIEGSDRLMTWIIKPDSSDVIEVYVQSLASLGDFFILGWFK